MYRWKGMGLFGMLMLAASLAVAQGPPPPDFGADLSPDQKGRLKSVMDSARKENRDLYAQLRSARQQLADLYDNYNLDERRINETTRRINRIQNEILLRHLRTQREIRKVVNPAQFGQMRKAMNKMRERRGPRRDRERGGDD